MSVTSTSPETRTINRLGSRKARRRVSPWLALRLALALAGGGYTAWQLTRTTPASITTATATASLGTISASVSGSGTVAAASSRTLSFPVDGTVSEVLVSVGDTVTAGQPLARLSTSELELAVMQAGANLKSAQAGVAAANGEGATPEEIAAARAQLRSAQASLTKTRTGDATANDIASAEAQLASAQAKLNELLAGPTAETLASAKASAEQARLSLQSQRASLAAAKTKAESQVTRRSRSA
ncbi:MAG: biotin/lipoyl-binding protein [Chloroflexales bacterium]|nr:biotin/lipoyl-binding protein [Chloroflexales bacterium]